MTFFGGVFQRYLPRCNGTALYYPNTMIMVQNMHSAYIINPGFVTTHIYVHDNIEHVMTTHNCSFDNGLSPDRRQAIIWTNAGILLIRTLGTNVSEILSEIQTFPFTKMHLKVSSAKWRLFCLCFNVIIHCSDFPLFSRWGMMIKIFLHDESAITQSIILGKEYCPKWLYNSLLADSNYENDIRSHVTYISSAWFILSLSGVLFEKYLSCVYSICGLVQAAISLCTCQRSFWVWAQSMGGGVTL